MGRRTQPEIEAGDGLENTEELGELELQPKRIPREPDRVPAFLRFSHLTHYAIDGRGDAKAEMQYVTAIPFTEDQELQRRSIRGATDLRGMFFRETRNKSQGVLKRDTLDVPSEAHGTAQAARTQPAPPQPVAQSETPANAVNSVTDAVRAVKDLQKELAPAATPAAPLTVADIERAAEAAAARAVEQFKATQPAAQQPKTLAEQLQELAGLGEVIDKLRGTPQTQAQPQAGDEFERVFTLLERVEKLKERVIPESGGRDDDSWAGKITSFIDVGGRTVERLAPIAEPFLHKLMVGAMQAQQPAATQPAATGAAQPASAAAVSPAQAALTNLIADLKRGKRVGRAADEIDDLVTKHPEYAPTLKGFLQRDEQDILRELSQLAGEDLTDYTHAIDWLADLKDELLPEDQDDDLAAGDGDEGDAGGDADAADAPNVLQMARERAS